MRVFLSWFARVDRIAVQLYNKPLSFGIGNMKFKQKYRILIILLSLTCIGAVVAWLLGYKTNFVIGVGVLISLLFFALWNPPPKHKEYSDADRLQAPAKSLGGNAPPELWTPDMPIKGKNRKLKKRG